MVFFIGCLLVIAFILSRGLTRDAFPFESLLAVGLVGVTCVVLFQMGRLG